MKRREFMTLIGSAAAAWPLAAGAQQPAMPVIGFLDSTSPETNADLLLAFHQGLTGAARVAVLVNPGNAAIAESNVRDVEAAARAIGLQIQVLKASTSREIDAAFGTFVRERPDAVFVGGGPFFRSRRVQMVQLSLDPRDIWVA
jgi:putative tryptophan/tyrosine transport system substrate-binding protein